MHTSYFMCLLLTSHNATGQMVAFVGPFNIKYFLLYDELKRDN